MNPVVVIHGGAWSIPDDLVSESISGVQIAGKIAWSVLSAGGSALDAVEAAVTSLENNPAFDAGTGAVLTSDGKVELDAMIMDGKNLESGAVACVQNIKNPIQLARLVMEKTDHTLLVGKGANDFALESGIPLAETKDLVTSSAIKEWERYKKYNNTVSSLFSERNGQNGHDTVGCVAIDQYGSVACATSTGGITAKRPGRVGDSPLIGSGGYADDESAAVSCTGHGESISKVCLAKAVVDRCSQGESPTVALQSGLDFMGKRVFGAGGGICIDKKGSWGIAFTTSRMAWAAITKDEASCGINPSEIIEFQN